MARELAPELRANALRLRLANRALELVLKQVGLASVAEKFNPDDANQAALGGEPGEVRFFVDASRDGARSVARVYVQGDAARVQVDDTRAIVRRAHRRGFDPREAGVPARVDGLIGLGDVLEREGKLLATAPLRPPMRRLARPAPRVIPALAGMRRSAE